MGQLEGTSGESVSYLDLGGQCHVDGTVDPAIRTDKTAMDIYFEGRQFEAALVSKVAETVDGYAKLQLHFALYSYDPNAEIFHGKFGDLYRTDNRAGRVATRLTTGGIPAEKLTFHQESQLHRQGLRNLALGNMLYVPSNLIRLKKGREALEVGYIRGDMTGVQEVAIYSDMMFAGVGTMSIGTMAFGNYIESRGVDDLAKRLHVGTRGLTTVMGIMGMISGSARMINEWEQGENFEAENFVFAFLDVSYGALGTMTGAFYLLQGLGKEGSAAHTVLRGFAIRPDVLAKAIRFNAVVGFAVSFYAGTTEIYAGVVGENNMTIDDRARHMQKGSLTISAGAMFTASGVAAATGAGIPVAVGFAIIGGLILIGSEML